MWNHEIKCCRKRLSLLVNCLATVKNHSDIFHQSKQCVIVKFVRFSGSLLMFILPAHSLNHQSPKLIVAFYLWLIILFRNRWIKVHHHRHHFVYCLYFTQMWHAHTYTRTSTLIKNEPIPFTVWSIISLYACFDYSRVIM